MIQICAFKKKKEGGEGRPQFSGLWKVLMFSGPWKVPMFGGQWKVLMFDGQWKVSMFDGLCKVPSLVGFGRKKKINPHIFSLSPPTKFT